MGHTHWKFFSLPNINVNVYRSVHKLYHVSLINEISVYNNPYMLHKETEHVCF